MVIISKDDYLSFLNEFGGKMQTPPAANVNNTQNSTSPIPINKFYNDQSQQSSGQTLQQQQQQQTPPQLQTHIERLREVMQESTNKQTNANNGNNKVLQTARAILICRPNSHPFQVSFFLLFFFLFFYYSYCLQIYFVSVDIFSLLLLLRAALDLKW